MRVEAPRVRALVLAAGAGSRFGGRKLEARVDGKPILQHVLDALAEAGLRWPLDVVTRRPVGYRLEGDRATAWLAGFDGKDDGGHSPYLDLLQATIAPGTDLIYRTFEMPPTLRTLGATSSARPGP